MKNFYQTFKNSIYNPSFYQNIATAPFWEAFRFYAKATVALAGVMAVALAVFLGIVGGAFIKYRAADLVKNYYPEALTINIDKGQASAQVAMPYFVPVKSMNGATTTVGSVQNLLVVDTNHEFDKKSFLEYKTYALLTKTDLVTSNEDGQITIQSLRNAPPMVISQAMLLSFIEQIRSHAVAIIIGGGIAMFVVFLLGFAFYLVILLLFALIPLLIAWIKKEQLSYSSAYKMSLYAIVPALALKTLLNIMGLFFLPAYLTLLVFMLVIALNMRNEEEPKLFEAR